MRTLLLASFLAVAGCGQSGDLYLPPRQSPPAEAAPPMETPPPVEGMQERQEEKEKQ